MTTDGGALLLLGGVAPPAPVAAIAGRLRVVDRRFQTDAGWFACRSVSDLAALGDVLHGRAADVGARFDAYQRAGRTMVRVLGMLGSPPWVAAGLDCSPRTPGYDAARQQVVDAANARGLYVELDLFADAQIVVPDAGEREIWTRAFAAFCRDTPGVLPGLTNEPAQNGWDACTDPALLALAEVFAAEVGHRDFSIGDPGDDDAEGGAAIAQQLIATSRHCRVAVWHPSRTYGGGDARWRRWIDHLEGMTDVVPQLADGVALLVQEPMGASLTAQPGRRDNDPDALLAAQVVSACCGFAGYTYHWIVGELPLEQLPGFYDDAAALLARLPVSPDWRYLNDAWPGAPTDGIRWSGKEGKVRNLVRGDEAWTVAYGDGDWASVRWRDGWTPTLAHEGPRLRVWRATR